MVLSCLSLTTTPWRVRFGIFRPLLLGVRGAFLRSDGLDACDVAASFTQARGVLELPGGALETQVEPLLLQIEDRILHLVGAHAADVVDLLCHHHHSAIRATKRVLIGSLAAARLSASFAV